MSIVKNIELTLRGEISNKEFKKELLKRVEKKDIPEIIVNCLYSLHKTRNFPPQIKSINLFKILRKTIKMSNGIAKKIFQMYFWPEIFCLNKKGQKILVKILRKLIKNKDGLEKIFAMWKIIFKKIYIKRIS